MESCRVGALPASLTATPVRKNHKALWYTAGGVRARRSGRQTVERNVMGSNEQAARVSCRPDPVSSAAPRRRLQGL